MTERERRWREAAQQWRDRDCSKCCLQLGCEYSKAAGAWQTRSWNHGCRS